MISSVGSCKGQVERRFTSVKHEKFYKLELQKLVADRVNAVVAS